MKISKSFSYTVIAYTIAYTYIYTLTVNKKWIVLEAR